MFKQRLHDSSVTPFIRLVEDRGLTVVCYIDIRTSFDESEDDLRLAFAHCVLQCRKALVSLLHRVGVCMAI